MKKILIQMRDLRVGSGVVSCIMSYFNSLIEEGYQVDFLLERYIESQYCEIVKKANCKIFCLPKDTGKPCAKNYIYVKKVLNNKYNIVHVNITGLNALILLRLAKKLGVETRIYHVHAQREFSSIKAIIRFNVYERPSLRYANKFVACSQSAGNSIFGRKKFTKISNAFDLSKYVYDLKAREIYRCEFKVENSYVIGVVGRFSQEKNPIFVIDILKALISKNNNISLLWIGDGELMEQTKNYAKDLGIFDNCVFAGARGDVNKIYSAFDAFLLPSKHEGLGLVFVEAQISGLKCFGSDQIPKDVDITDDVYHISLDKKAQEWADIVFKTCSNTGIRINHIEEAQRGGFDINLNKTAFVSLYN